MNLSLQPKGKGQPPVSERDQRIARFRRSAVKADKDYRVDEYLGPKDDDYIFNIGYTQTTQPVLTATAPPEFTGKTGYYGKQGTYYIPTGDYRDHPIYHDMKNHNSRFNYMKGLTHTNIASDIVREEDERWNQDRELRVMSRNFTSLTKEELTDRALK